MTDFDSVEWADEMSASGEIRGMTTDELKRLHKMVWDFRQDMEDYFPTPNQKDSLAFAFTEIAEAVDAQLRQNPTYKRNNEKAHTVERELAQCAMMLFTSLGEAEVKVFGYDLEGYQYPLDKIAYWVTELYTYSDDFVPEDCLWILSAIAELIDLPLHLSAELERMRQKHGPVRDDGPASQNEPANEHYIETEHGDNVSWQWVGEKVIRYRLPAEGLKLTDHTEGMSL